MPCVRPSLPLAFLRRGAGRVVAAILAVALVGLAPVPPAAAKGPAPDLPVVALGQLPPEAAVVMDQIRSGGPFRYERDGVVFGNREQLLPGHPRGYYREYTVPTPKAKNRGARRIVCGGPPKTPEACYYTGDHYQSFARIQP